MYNRGEYDRMEEQNIRNQGRQLFSDDLEKEEKELLIKKTDYYKNQENLPKELLKPVELLYDSEKKCIGYTYLEPDFPYVSFKELAKPHQLEAYHVDGHLLFSIARKLLYILMELSEREIYPGLLTLDSILVHKRRPDKAIMIRNPEHFQAGNLPSTFPWYPSDSRLFDEEEGLFTAESQKKADAKLIYKILTVSEKGNAKIPPNPKTQELSYLFWNILSREWKDFFLNLGNGNIEYEDMMELLNQSIEEEQYYTTPADRAMTEEVVLPAVPKSEKKKKAYAAIAILREAEKYAHDISQKLYLLQEMLEEDPVFSYEQAFILGDRHPFSRDFSLYPEGFRSQLAHKIRSYSFGEALLIGADLLENALKKEEHPAYFFLLLDGEIKNDAMFQAGLKKLETILYRYSVKAVLLSVSRYQGEGYQKLTDLFQEY